MMSVPEAAKSPTVEVRPRQFAPRSRNVYIDGAYAGVVFPSDAQWVHGWRAVTAEGKNLGDQPRRKDAEAILVAFLTSPFRSPR